MNPLLKKLMTLDEERIAALYKRVFNTDDGQLVLEDLKQRGFEYVPSFAGDPYHSAFNEGKRAVVIHIQTQLNYELKPEIKPGE